MRDLAVITRRSTLGLLAASAMLPARALAHVAPPRNEVRESLAKRFTDLGTSGTFVAYKVDDYLVVASDTQRSGEAKIPASTFKIPNSLIALETGVVADPDKDVFAWDGVKRPIEAWNRDHTLRSAIAVGASSVSAARRSVAMRSGSGMSRQLASAARAGGVAGPSSTSAGGGVSRLGSATKRRR